MAGRPESPGDVPRPEVPDFYIVGHAKCGTTALYEMLRQHPQIFMPDYAFGAGKEPWFFSRENPQPQTTPERSVAFTGRRTMSLDEYLSLFEQAQPGQRVGEASTSYLWSPSAAARIAELRPDASIIAILREPASFLRSLHLQLLQNKNEDETDFRTALTLDEPRREGRMIPHEMYWPAALIYSDRVRYVEQLRRYEEAFGRDRMLVLIYDDLRNDNEGTVRQVLRFLDVNDSVPLKAAWVNPSGLRRRGRVATFTRKVRDGRDPGFGTVRRMLDAVTTDRMRESVLPRLRRKLLWEKAPPPDQELMAEIRARYKSEVVAASDYLGRDLVSLWGYDKLG
jgi:hypothetical protein